MQVTTDPDPRDAAVAHGIKATLLAPLRVDVLFPSQAHVSSVPQLWSNLPRLPPEPAWHCSDAGEMGPSAGASTQEATSEHADWGAFSGARVSAEEGGVPVGQSRRCPCIVLALAPGHFEVTGRVLRSDGHGEWVDWASSPGCNVSYDIGEASSTRSLSCHMVDMLTCPTTVRAVANRHASVSSLPGVLSSASLASSGSGSDLEPPPSDALSPAFASRFIFWLGVLRLMCGEQEAVPPSWISRSALCSTTALQLYSAAALSADLELSGAPPLVAMAAAWLCVGCGVLDQHRSSHLLRQRFSAEQVDHTTNTLQSLPATSIALPDDLESYRPAHVGTLAQGAQATVRHMAQAAAGQAGTDALPKVGSALLALGLGRQFLTVGKGGVGDRDAPAAVLRPGTLACGVCAECKRRCPASLWRGNPHLDLLLALLRSPALPDAALASRSFVQDLAYNLQLAPEATQRKHMSAALKAVFQAGVARTSHDQGGLGAGVVSLPSLPLHVVTLVAAALTHRVRVTALSVAHAAAHESRFPARLLEEGMPDGGAGQGGLDGGGLSILLLQSPAQAQADTAAHTPEALSPDTGHDADGFSSAAVGAPSQPPRISVGQSLTAGAPGTDDAAPVVVLRGHPQPAPGMPGLVAQHVMVHPNSDSFLSPSFGPLPFPDLGEPPVAGQAPTALGTMAAPEPAPLQAVVPHLDELPQPEESLPPVDSPVRVRMAPLALPGPARMDAPGQLTLAQPTQVPSPESTGSPDGADGAFTLDLPPLTSVPGHKHWAAWSSRWDPSLTDMAQGTVVLPFAGGAVGCLGDLLELAGELIAASAAYAVQVTGNRPSGRSSLRRLPPRSLSAGHMDLLVPPSTQLDRASGQVSGAAREMRHLVRCLMHITTRLSSAVCGEYGAVRQAARGVLERGGAHSRFAAWRMLRCWPRADAEQGISHLDLLTSTVRGWWGHTEASLGLDLLGHASSDSANASEARALGYRESEVPDLPTLRAAFLRRLVLCLGSPHARLAIAAAKALTPSRGGHSRPLATIISRDADMCKQCLEAVQGKAVAEHWSSQVRKNGKVLQGTLQHALNRMEATEAQRRRNAEALAARSTTATTFPRKVSVEGLPPSPRPPPAVSTPPAATYSAQRAGSTDGSISVGLHLASPPSQERPLHAPRRRQPSSPPSPPLGQREVIPSILLAPLTVHGGTQAKGGGAAQ